MTNGDGGWGGGGQAAFPDTALDELVCRAGERVAGGGGWSGGRKEEGDMDDAPKRKWQAGIHSLFRKEGIIGHQITRGQRGSPPDG